MEDLRSLNMVIVEMRIDDMANGQPTDLAEFTEGRPGGGHTISRVDHNHASISDHIKNVTDCVMHGGIHAVSDLDEFGSAKAALPSAGRT
jgi:hypothetical protein